ncbi:MAG: hypothetical protein HY690_18400 [Chloroflexi bacterium]|nr:hypothetical protein [Chloroflexota bacterium]
MNLMLVAILLCVGLGLLARRFGPRQDLAIALLATVLTALYLFSARAM